MAENIFNLILLFASSFLLLLWFFKSINITSSFQAVFISWNFSFLFIDCCFYSWLQYQPITNMNYSFFGSLTLHLEFYFCFTLLIHVKVLLFSHFFFFFNFQLRALKIVSKHEKDTVARGCNLVFQNVVTVSLEFTIEVCPLNWPIWMAAHFWGQWKERE